MICAKRRSDAVLNKNLGGIEMYLYEKTLLSCFNCMEEVIDKMEKTFVEAAVGSYTCLSPCEVVAEKLIAMTERKINLIEIRNKVVRAFNKLDGKKRQFISFKYFKRFDDEIAEIKNTREYFRKNASALKAFSSSLLHIGFTEEKFFEACGKYPFIMQVYYDFKEREENRNKLPSRYYKIVNRTEVG